MMRSFRFLAVLAALAAAGCGFESGRQNLMPSGGSGGSGLPAVSVWTSQSFTQIPDPRSCGNFEWKITSQTSTTMAGDFTASCASGSVEVNGTASGHLTSEATVALTASGNASAAGVVCPFSLTGNGFLENPDTLRVEYNGTTCLGPIQGVEWLHRPPSDNGGGDDDGGGGGGGGENPYHVGTGPLTEERAKTVVNNTAAEFPHLIAGHPDVNQKIANTEELLLRTIWHLQLAGYQAGRQQNPSGAISKDKLTILLNGSWQAVDIYTNFDVPNVATSVIWWPVSPANYQPNPGIPD